MVKKRTTSLAAAILIAVLSAPAQNTSPVAGIDGRTLEMYPDLLLSNALQGRLAGLVAIGSSNGLGNNSSALYVHGLHSASGNPAITVIDGQERDIDDLAAEEVERIEVLKDASAQILYGPRAANGVILVTTRRGAAGKQTIRTSLEYGVKQATRTPVWLGSYDYARLYNEARSNDRLPVLYSDAQLNGYRDSSGTNDLSYPDTDWYAYFIRPLSTFRKCALTLDGGSGKVRYAACVTYTGGDGFERYGAAPSYDRINLRGHVDSYVTDYLSVSASIAARMKVRSWAGLNQAEVFSQISTMRPLEYPMMIPWTLLGETPEDGVPAFGASTKSASNLLADLVYGGRSSERYITASTDIGLDFHLDAYVPGLSGHVGMMLDNYSYIAQSQSDVYPTWSLSGTNPDRPEFTRMRNLNLSSDQTLSSDLMRLTTGTRADARYVRTWGDHGIEAAVDFKYYHYKNPGDTQDIVNANTALSLTYRFQDKAFLHAIAALMESNRFAVGHRWYPARSVEAGYRFSPAIGITAGTGVLGYDRSTDALLYRTAWKDGGNFTFGEQNKGNIGRTTTFIRSGADLDWERAWEGNLDVDGTLKGGRLTYSAGTFAELRKDIICPSSGIDPAVIGPFTTYVNIGKVRNMGAEATFRWKDRAGAVFYEAGAHAAWSKNRILQWGEPDYPDDGLSWTGKASDAIRGLEALGLYGKDLTQEGAPRQDFGPVTTGSVAYRDRNGDGTVDARDRTVIGNTFPRLSGGIDIRLSYKRFELYVLGTWLAGMSNLLNSAYFWNYGENKYSVLALDRYHPVNNPGGSYPALTTTGGTNDFQNSTLWVQDGSFFRIKDLELSYTFPAGRNLPKGLKVFLRGTNLFVLSAQRYLDPEVIHAGITNYPYYRTLTCGIAFRTN